MSASISITATCFGDKPLTVLNKLIEKRQHYIRGETTESAVVATAINILTSIKTDTRVAIPKDDYGALIRPRNDMIAGWKTEGAPHRVVRLNLSKARSHEVKGMRVINLAGQYQRGERVRVFDCVLKYPDQKEIVNVPTASEYKRFVVIAKSADEVLAFVKKKLDRHSRTYGGMAKWTVGQAQAKIATSGGKNVANKAVNTKAMKIGNKNWMVNVFGDGWSSGRFTVEVKDALNYAMPALKLGRQSFDIALKKAANKTYGIIKHYIHEHPYLGDDLGSVAPFPEVMRKR